MAQERPVVGTRVGGIPEFVHHDATGLLHAHEDEADLAAQVVSLLDDPEKAARLARAGRELVDRQVLLSGEDRGGQDRERQCNDEAFHDHFLFQVGCAPGHHALDTRNAVSAPRATQRIGLSC